MFPILEFKYGKGPFAVIKTGDRNLDLIKCKRTNGKFFLTNLGVFELDGAYELRQDTQIFYIYNLHNPKPLSLRAIEDIQQKYLEGENQLIVDEIKDIEKAIEQEKATKSPVAILAHLANKAEGEGLEDYTKRFLVDQKIYDKEDAKLFQSQPLITRKPLPAQSGHVSPMAPMGIFASAAIMGLIIMSQLPHWMHWF